MSSSETRTSCSRESSSERALYLFSRSASLFSIVVNHPAARCAEQYSPSRGRTVQPGCRQKDISRFTQKYKRSIEKRCLPQAVSTSPWCSGGRPPMESRLPARRTRRRNTALFYRTVVGASLDRQRMKITFNTEMKPGEGSFGHACGAYSFWMGSAL